MFKTLTGEYVSLRSIKNLCNGPFDTEDAVIAVLRGVQKPTNAIWAKKRVTDDVIVIDLNDPFNHKTLGISVDSRAYHLPPIFEEAERLIVEEWHRLDKKRKKKKKKLAKK